MNTTTKLQVVAGIFAVVALPLLYFGLHEGSTTLPWLGLTLFLIAMMITPLLRILPSDLSYHDEANDV